MFDIIVIDPPWKYKSNTGTEGLAEYHYEVMDVDRLKQFKIDKLANPNCVLFMWSTCPKLDEAIDLIRHWGFEYKTVGFTWIKTKNGKVFMGLGNYTRSSTELCLLAMKGKMSVINHSIYQVVISEVMNHSKKPEIVQDMIEKLFGSGLNMVEVFARRKRDGWLCVGNQL